MDKTEEEIKRPAEGIVRAFYGASTGDVSDALDKLGIRGVISHILPIIPEVRIAGPAITLRQISTKEYQSKIIPSHVEVVEKMAKVGDVVVIDAGGRTDICTWGGQLTMRAKMKGLQGVVIDGTTRDLAQIREIKFPVFARGVSPSMSYTRLQTFCVNEVIQCGGIQVCPGDIVVGDDDGVAIVPREKAEDVLKLTKEKARYVEKMMEQLNKGKSFEEAQRALKYGRVDINSACVRGP